MLGLKSHTSEYLKEFCQETSIHGLPYISEEKRWLKWFWIIIFSSMLVLTLYACTGVVIGYYRYNVASRVTYETQTGFQFPQITFCKQFALSKRKAKGNEAILFHSAAFMATEWSQIPELLKNNIKYCRKNVSVDTYYTMEKVSNMSMIEFNQFIHDSFDSVLKCWWNNIEVECDGFFNNVILNDGSCFGLAQNKEVMKLFFQSRLSSLGYGLNLSSITDWIAYSTRSDSTARFLLDFGEYDSCDTTHGYSGSGFKLFISDIRDGFLVDNVLPRISLMPGYRIDVSLRPTLFNRKTEHMQKCVSGMFPFGDEMVYFKSICLNVCFFKITFKECNCSLPYMDGLEQHFNRLLEMNVSTYSKCSAAGSKNQVECLKRVMYKVFKSDSPTVYCPKCIEPCYVTKYSTLLTYRKFPARKDLGYYQRLLNVSMNLTEFRKNYLVVDFSFDQMTRLTVVETQAITTSDIMMAIGSFVGLFMGMSFMSFGELLHLSLEFAVHFLFKLFNWNKFRQRVVSHKVLATGAKLPQTVTTTTKSLEQNRTGQKQRRRKKQKNKIAIVANVKVSQIKPITVSHGQLSETQICL